MGYCIEGHEETKLKNLRNVTAIELARSFIQKGF